MCHLPRNAVRYPADWSVRGKVCSAWLARLRDTLSMMPCREGNCPVSRVARLGEHNGTAWNELVNSAPSAASRSMLGVSRYGWPPAPNSSQRRSSTTTTTRLGRSGVGARPAGGSAGGGPQPASDSASSPAERRPMSVRSPARSPWRARGGEISLQSSELSGAERRQLSQHRLEPGAGEVEIPPHGGRRHLPGFPVAIDHHADPFADGRRLRFAEPLARRMSVESELEVGQGLPDGINPAVQRDIRPRRLDQRGAHVAELIPYLPDLLACDADFALNLRGLLLERGRSDEVGSRRRIRYRFHVEALRRAQPPNSAGRYHDQLHRVSARSQERAAGRIVPGRLKARRRQVDGVRIRAAKIPAHPVQSGLGGSLEHSDFLAGRVRDQQQNLGTALHRLIAKPVESREGRISALLPKGFLPGLPRFTGRGRGLAQMIGDDRARRGVLRREVIAAQLGTTRRLARLRRHVPPGIAHREEGRIGGQRGRDRKSTRLNSSHSQISYAVFCLKKKKT